MQPKRKTVRMLHTCTRGEAARKTSQAWYEHAHLPGRQQRCEHRRARGRRQGPQTGRDLWRHLHVNRVAAAARLRRPRKVCG